MIKIGLHEWFRRLLGVLWSDKFNGSITNDYKGIILVKVNIKWSRLDYKSDFGAYLGFNDLIIVTNDCKGHIQGYLFKVK